MAQWNHHMLLMHWANQTLQFTDHTQKRFTELESNTNEFLHSNVNPLAVEQFCVNAISPTLMNKRKKN